MSIKKFIRTGAVVAALGVTLVACEHDGGSPAPSSQKQGQQQTETAFAQQSSAVPYPLTALTDSTERRNLRERLLRFNKPKRIGYVYIMTITGSPIGYYSIEGKISNPDSQMTTSELVKYSDCGSACGYSTVTTAPGDDGSYGPNESGIFFFTTEGALIETSMPYLYSDQPIPAFIDLPKLNGKGKVADLSDRQ